MNTHTHTVQIRGANVAFRSAFATDAEAIRALRDAGGPTQFAQDILRACSGAHASPRQIAWLHKLATEATAGRRTGAVEGLNLLAVVQLLHRAAAAQKRAPRVTLSTRDGDRVVLSLCGPRSKTPGAVRITNGAPYGSPGAVFYGTILADGSVEPARGWCFEAEALLVRLGREPHAVAGQHGVATGECSFCSRLLSTKQSRSVGYGPDCADRYGLPWGEVSDEVEAEHLAAQLPAPRLNRDDVLEAEAVAELQADEAAARGETLADPFAGLGGL